MDQQTLLYIMTAFVVIAGISLLMQFVMIFGIYKTVKATQAKLDQLLPKVHTLVESSQVKINELMPKVNTLIEASQKTIEQGRQQVMEITAKTNEILESTKRQIAKVEEVVNDASGRARAQIERAEMVLDDTMTRAHETVASVHNGVMRPMREIQGIAAGVRTAISHLARGTRPSVAQATHDEEMFI